MLDHQHGRPVVVDAVDAVEHVLDQVRSEPGRGFIQQQQVGVEHQRPAHCEHLLLAARQRPRGLVGPLTEDGEPLVHRFDAVLRDFVEDIRAHLEVFAHAQRAEHVSGLWDVADSLVDYLVGTAPADVCPVEDDLAAHVRRQAEDGLHHRRFPGPVRADDDDVLAVRDVHVDVAEHLQVAVAGVEVPNREQALGRVRQGDRL